MDYQEANYSGSPNSAAYSTRPQDPAWFTTTINQGIAYNPTAVVVVVVGGNPGALGIEVVNYGPYLFCPGAVVIVVKAVIQVRNQTAPYPLA